MSASFPTYGFDPVRLAERLRERGLAAALLTSPENVFYTTGYTTLPSAGNPILYMLRNRLPYYALVDADGKVTLGCWGFSTEGVEFGADTIVRFNDFGGALAGLQELLEAHARRGPLAVESTCPRLVGDIASAASGGAQPAACAGRSLPVFASSSLNANGRGSSAASRSSSRLQPNCSTRCTSACRGSSSCRRPGLVSCATARTASAI